MTDIIAARYKRLAGQLADTIAEVDHNRWNDQSPCEGWSLLDVLRHVISTQSLVAGFMDRELGPGPSPGSDPLGAWINASDQIHAQLLDPVLATELFDGLSEPLPWAEVVDRLLNFDLVVHRWDIAKGAEVRSEIVPEDLTWATGVAHAMGDDLHSEGVCGPALAPPPGSSPQVELLAFLGRRDW